MTYRLEKLIGRYAKFAIFRKVRTLRQIGPDDHPVSKGVLLVPW